MWRRILGAVIAYLTIPLCAGIINLFLGESFVQGFLEGCIADVVLTIFIGGILAVTILFDN